MNEHVRLAIALFDKTEALGGIEKLHGSSSHCDLLSKSTQIIAAWPLAKRRAFEIEMEYRQGAKARKQRSFNKIDVPYIALNFHSGKGASDNTFPDTFQALHMDRGVGRTPDLPDRGTYASAVNPPSR
ncbi:hypothetical protein [Mesorhizobium sp.]|uniref:hypothetical protein n=1 Tax=Mesorhizobium sp. TaxID=1871066 RepID=UPI0025BD50A1|nr:hypothetical protein [Mesorhizobium sp.]